MTPRTPQSTSYRALGVTRSISAFMEMAERAASGCPFSVSGGTIPRRSCLIVKRACCPPRQARQSAPRKDPHLRGVFPTLNAGAGTTRLGRAEGTVGQRAAHVGGLLCWSDFLVPQQFSCSVEIFSPEGIVGQAVTRILLLVDVLGVPAPRRHVRVAAPSLGPRPQSVLS